MLQAAESLLEANRGLQGDLDEANAEIQRQRRQLESFVAAAHSDALTGLANRRRFDAELEQRCREQAEQGTGFSLILIDVDHFKQINDAHGHPRGDALLKELAAVLAASVRPGDLVVRHGGDEFALILGALALDDARKLAERIRRNVEEHPFEQEIQGVAVTLSLGLAESIPGDTPQSIVGRADAALYAAKQAGRNTCRTGAETAAGLALLLEDPAAG